MAIYAAVRAGALKSIGTGRGGILSTEYHAKRLDPVSQKRHIRDSDPIAWSKAEGPTDYVEAFKAHKRATGAGERKGADLGMELKVVVSPEWLAETGDPHDAANPRVQQLVEEAQAWAESWGGPGSVWGVRYDTDERGSGVVDLFMSPVREQRHKSGKSKAVISCRKAKEELLASERALEPDLKTSGAAMQSSWARWAQKKLDHRLERGKPKEETGAVHQNADLYARIAQQKEADLKAREEALAEKIEQAKAWHENRKRAFDEQRQKHLEFRAAWEAKNSETVRALEKTREETRKLHQHAQNIRDRESKRADARYAFLRAFLNGKVERVGIDEKGQSTVTFGEKTTESDRVYLTDLTGGWFNPIYDFLAPLQRFLDKFRIAVEERAEIARSAGYDPDDSGDWDDSPSLGI